MPENPSVDFSRYVALGDSITAGYADGALYREAQHHAWANILATQMRQLGGGEFKQALMPVGSPGIDPGGAARLVLQGGTELRERRLVRAATTGDLTALGVQLFATEGPFHNLGVPGAKVTTLPLPGVGNPAHGPGFYNPFFTRMASDPLTASPVSDALALQPTFFSVFIGNNDALAYALSGGTIGEVTPTEGPVGYGFRESLNEVLGALTSGGAQGVIANLPPISTVPYFTTVPANGLHLTTAEANSLNLRYLPADFGWKAGTNFFVVQHPATGLCQLAEGDLVLMDLLLDTQAEDYLCGRQPLPKQYVLTAAEVHTVNLAIDQYNHIIREAAERYQLAFVDIHALVRHAVPDRVYNVQRRQLEFRGRGVFSLDGLHPNAFGQAIIANEFIAGINKHFGTHLAPVHTARFSAADRRSQA